MSDKDDYINFVLTTNSHFPKDKVESFANPVNEFFKPIDDAAFLPLDRYGDKHLSDAHHLQQLAGESAIELTPYYAHQFHQNEQHTQDGVTQECVYLLEHTPIVPGTLTGTVMVEDGDEDASSWNAFPSWKAVQTFVFSKAGDCKFAEVDPDWPVRAVDGMLNLLTDELTLWFNVGHPGKHKLIISYEVNVEPMPEVDPDDAQFAQVENPVQPPVWGQQGKCATYKNQNTTSYIDYLVNQLSETKSRLFDAEDKLDAIRKSNGGQKTLAELEVELYNEYEKKLQGMKEYFIDKVDQYLKVQSEDGLREMASRPSVEIFEEATQN